MFIESFSKRLQPDINKCNINRDYCWSCFVQNERLQSLAIKTMLTGIMPAYYYCAIIVGYAGEK